MLTFRDWNPPRELASRSLPRFPERIMGRAARRNTPGLLASRAERHARIAWDDAKRYAVNKAGIANRITDGKPTGLLELTMVAALAEHLAKCPHCWIDSPYSGEKPAEWITWATMNSRLKPYLLLASEPIDRRKGRPCKRCRAAMDQAGIERAVGEWIRRTNRAESRDRS